MASGIYSAIQAATVATERADQDREYKVGISTLGWCSERTRRMLKQEDPGDTDMLTAWLGTAIGDAAEQAVLQHLWPDALIQPTVTLTLRGERQRTYSIPGHPDVILPWGVVVDFKTQDGLLVAERTGMDERQKKFQRHGYALAAFEDGLFNDDVGLDDVLVGNCWIDRSGSEKRVLVRLEPYDPEVTRETLDWLEEVVWAFQTDSEARKEPPREMCAKTCGFFATCRAYDTDVSGLLTDADTLAAMDLYLEGQRLASDGRKMQDQAKSVLRGTEGFAVLDGQRLSLRWTHVNEVLTAPSVRRAHDKIELKRLP
jgi:hypothetical protein